MLRCTHGTRGGDVVEVVGVLRRGGVARLRQPVVHAHQDPAVAVEEAHLVGHLVGLVAGLVAPAVHPDDDGRATCRRGAWTSRLVRFVVDAGDRLVRHRGGPGLADAAVRRRRRARRRARGGGARGRRAAPCRDGKSQGQGQAREGAPGDRTAGRGRIAHGRILAAKCEESSTIVSAVLARLLQCPTLEHVLVDSKGNPWNSACS